MVFFSATFWAGVNASHCPITCPKRHIPRTKGDKTAAIADYTEAIRIAPDFRGYGSRGELFFETGDYERAIADFTEAFRLFPHDPSTTELEAECYSYRGRAWALSRGKKKDYKQAILDFQEAIKLAPDNEEYPRLLAETQKEAAKGIWRLIRMGIGAVIGFAFVMALGGGDVPVLDVIMFMVFCAIIGLILPFVKRVFRVFKSVFGS